jgi:SAM-dependent methyltransferase
MPIDMRATWDRLSARYQEQQPDRVDSVDYGPWAPPERELRLLGDVRGRHVLDLGCGGGQSVVALARQGAVVTGLDLSDAQLAVARRRAAEAQVAVTLVQGSAETLAPLPDGAFDLIFSANVFPYVADLPRCLEACRRTIKPAGRLVFSLDHPLRTIFWDASEDEWSIFPIRNYFDRSPIAWRWQGDADLQLRSHHLPVAAWIDHLADAGFRLRRLLEPPPPPELLDALWPEDGALAPLRNLPQTIIFVAERG